MTAKISVGIIYGGKSPEHDVSVMSANHISSLFNLEKYDVIPIHIDQQGQWGLSDAIIRDLQNGIDVVFPVIHGVNGEDGTIQGLLELTGIPYVGSGVMASAIARDKASAKALMAAHRLPVIDYQLVERSTWEFESDLIIEKLENKFRYPFYVKPANTGSSLGISKVLNQEKLKEALNEASRFDRRIIVEEAIEGREVSIGILGNTELQISELGEVNPTGEFFDYQAKYTSGGAKLIMPVDLPARVVVKIRSMAVIAYHALDCAGMARIDFFVTRNQRVYINKVHTIPGFTPYSIFPQLWERSGISQEALVERLIELALERHKYKKS